MKSVTRGCVLALLASMLSVPWDVASAIADTAHKPVPARANPTAADTALLTSESVSVTHIFDDAVSLKQFIATGQSGKAVALLKAYGVNVADIKNAPFLNKISYFRTTAFIRSLNPVPVPLATPQGLGLSGLGAGPVADALGSLIAERFKQEAEMEALRALGALMLRLDCKYPGAPLTAGFPGSITYLKTLHINPSPPCPPKIQLRPVDVNDWSVLQSSFKVDVAALPDNLPVFLDALYGNSDKMDARYLTWLASTSAGEIYRNGRNPYQIIDTAVRASDAFWKSKHLSDDGSPNPIANVDAGLRVLSILSHLLTKDGSSQWHSVEEIDDFLKVDACENCGSVFLLLGLSYARDHALYDGVDRWLTNRHRPTIREMDAGALGADRYLAALNSLVAQTRALASELDSLYQHVREISVPIRSISEARPLVSDFGAIAISATGAVEAFLEARTVSEAELAATNCAPDDSYCAIRQRLTMSTRELQYGFDIVGDIRTKQYGAAVGQLIAFIDAYRDSLGAATANDFATFFTDHGPFIAAVASAESSDDLKAALDTYALPAGSYTQQQTAKFSVTLNSFFGVAVGAETLVGNLEGTGVAKTRTHLGFAAPVGLDFNFGRVLNRTQAPSGRFFDTGAWSLFVPVLDVGAVASWRLGSGGGSVSAITWQNIVAPGLYAVWSKRDSPFSVLFGAQYGPELRKVSAGGNTLEKAAIQFPSIEFTFNIPIFNLYR